MSSSWRDELNPLHLLLLLVPVAVFLKFTHASPLLVFVISGIAIIPLAGLMGRATEVLADRLGSGLGGLLNATFGNAAELIIAVFALQKGMTEVVKASITGSILGNLLLVLGASFFAGGMRYRRQTFNATAAGMSATLLIIASTGLLVPAVFHFHINYHHPSVDEQAISVEIAVVLFVAYLALLLFSLRTHKHLYSGEDVSDGTDAAERLAMAHSHDASHIKNWQAGLLLCLATLGVAWMSEHLVGAVEEARTALGWTEVFVGVVVIAIVGNAAEHSTAVFVAMKNRMDLSVQIAVGSALQIALFVAPVLVFVSYLPGFPHRLDLVFTMLEVAAVLITSVVIGMVAYDGESNWLEGVLLLAVYVILGIAFFHIPAGA